MPVQTTVTDERTPTGGRRLTFVALRGAQFLLLFVSALIVSRRLGPSGRGEYAVPLAAAGLIWPLLTLSIEPATRRMIARGDLTMAELLRLRSLATLLLGGAGCVIGLLAAAILPDRLLGHADSATILLAVVTIPLWIVIQSTGATLLLVSRTSAYGVALLVSAGAQCIAAAGLAIAHDLTPATAMLAVAVGLGLGAMLLIGSLAQQFGIRALAPAAERAHVDQAVRIGLTLHPAVIGIALNLQVDVLFVGALRSRREVGLYSLANVLAQSAFLASEALAQSAIGEQALDTARRAAEFTAGFVRRTARLASVVVLASIAISSPAVEVLYGKQWLGMVPALNILLVTGLATVIGGPVVNFLNRATRPRVIAILGLGTVLANAGLDAALIPSLGIEGAALSSLASYLAYAGIATWLFCRATGISPVSFVVSKAAPS